jgi:hypothetical protein
MRRRPSFWIYLVGVIVLGAVYPLVLKPSFEPWLAVAISLGYLVGLRLLGWVVERRLRERAR